MHPLIRSADGWAMSIQYREGNTKLRTLKALRQLALAVSHILPGVVLDLSSQSQTGPYIDYMCPSKNSGQLRHILQYLSLFAVVTARLFILNYDFKSIEFTKTKKYIKTHYEHFMAWVSVYILRLPGANDYTSLKITQKNLNIFSLTFIYIYIIYIFAR